MVGVDKHGTGSRFINHPLTRRTNSMHNRTIPIEGLHKLRYIMRIAGTRAKADHYDTRVVSGIRVALAGCASLAATVDSAVDAGASLQLLLAAYLLYGAGVWMLSRRGVPIADSRLLHWIDTAWLALMLTNIRSGSEVLFLFLFLFAVLTASFRHGFEEGCRVTLAAALALLICGSVAQGNALTSRLWLHAALLLSLGYMCAYWGEAAIAARKRLVLLHELANLAQPRFGVDHVFGSMLDHIRRFYDAERCIALAESVSTHGQLELRIATDRPDAPIPALPPETARQLLSLPGQRKVRFNATSAPGWLRRHPRDGAVQRVAELLAADHYISVPFMIQRRHGRIYLASRAREFSHADVAFLADVMTQACRSLDNVAVVEQMSLDAAGAERKRLANDLHDDVIQTYLGLNFALRAILRKTHPHNPVHGDLAHLSDMAIHVIADLRQYAGALRAGARGGATVLHEMLQQKAARLGTFYGIDIAVDAPSDLWLDERLAADVLQVVHEGLSNICRHTTAQKGMVKVRKHVRVLQLRIENETADALPAAFHPRSMAERVEALGGRLQVMHTPAARTSILIDIPI
jgi:signal transduction histidine kinase